MGRREDPIVVVEREGSATVVWFLVGGAVGAALALLFAPHSGDHTRRVFGRRLNKLRDAADQAYSDLKQAMAKEDGAGRIETVDEEDEEEDATTAESAKDREEDDPGAGRSRRGAAAARRELEQRLAEARARRHRALSHEDEEPVA